MLRIHLLAIVSTFCYFLAVNGNLVTNDDRSSLFSHFIGLFKKPKPEIGGKISGYPTVRTDKGNIRGQTNDFAHSFYAIPFAEAPVGARRFMPPVEKRFQAEIEASKPNPVRCFQSFGENMSEDCLVLSIHVPKNVNPKSFGKSQFDRLLPVMVWIHGGGFQKGSGTETKYDGRFLSSSTNTLVVTINYRLGAFGFLVYEEGGVRFNGNQGLKDQQLALKWIKDHIKKFGGDPEQVTIFGESAGAQSVMLHMASKVSKPYFKRCIMESNPAVFDYPTIDRAEKVGDKLVELLHCGRKYQSNIQCLRSVHPSKIIGNTHWISVAAVINRDVRSMVEPFRPVVDGDEFPKQPFAMFQEGNWNSDVDVIVGTNRQELYKPLFTVFRLSLSKFQLLNNYFLGRTLGRKVSEHYLKLVSGAAWHYNYNHLLFELLGDYFFVCPTRLLTRFISQTSKSNNVYLYSWEHSSLRNPAKSCHYSGHTCEIPYVFKTTEVVGFPNGRKAKTMSAMFSDLWGSFAYTGVPTSKLSDTWLKYDGTTDRDLHIKYPRARMEVNYKKARCDFWDSQNYYAKL